MDNLESEADITEETFRDLVKAFYLREELIKEITSDIQPVQEQVWARHILVDDEETANQLLEQLEDGDAFSELAQEFSSDTASGQRGGDLGWFGRGMMTPVFEEAAFAPDIGEISDPIATNFGWHKIQVIGKEERPFDPRTLQELKNQAFSEWLQEKRAEYEVEVNENWPEYLPNEPQVPQPVVEYITLQEQQLLQPQLQPTIAPETE
jgi:parvulin-like peptidyl-prolyl isomerase